MTDEESLSKENINIETTINELKIFETKINNIKNKIEEEINNINSLFDKTNNDLKKYFLKKHEELVKQENDLKEKLENEVTKIKEKLENNLSKCNNEIKLKERIEKGIKNFEKNEKNLIKTLTYLSNINKMEKEMKNIIQQLMKSIKFSFQEEKANIKFDEYYFSGIATPDNIEFKNITHSSLVISWNINDINLINLDKNNFKYKVEKREEKGIFKQVYEGKENNCLIEKLNINTNYEFRICSVYEDILGPWTEIKKIKITDIDIDSEILKGESKKYEFIQKIFEWSGYTKMELLYRGSRDGMNADSFHSKCDNKDKTIVLIHNDKGCIFGGYASIPWQEKYSWKNAPDCFIFTLKNIYDTEPIKFPSKKNGYEVGHFKGYGPLFGDNGDIYFYSNFQADGDRSPYSGFPISYEDILGKGKSIFTGDSNNNNKKFKVKEIEVFKLF